MYSEIFRKDEDLVCFLPFSLAVFTCLLIQIASFQGPALVPIDEERLADPARGVKLRLRGILNASPDPLTTPLIAAGFLFVPFFCPLFLLFISKHSFTQPRLAGGPSKRCPTCRSTAARRSKSFSQRVPPTSSRFPILCRRSWSSFCFLRHFRWRAVKTEESRRIRTLVLNQRRRDGQYPTVEQQEPSKPREEGERKNFFFLSYVCERSLA